MGAFFLDYFTVCRVCGKQIKQVPFRKIDPFIIMEEYCPYCENSNFRFVDFEKL
jgi:hypothetical protein